MANRKYQNVSQAKEARRRCNRDAQRRYRDKIRMQRLAPQASPSDSTMRDEIEEEEPSAIGRPEASVQEAIAENVRDERREPDPLSPTRTPLERVASIDQALDELLISVEDPCVQQSLQDSIARVEPKFKDLVSRVHQTEQSAGQLDAPIMSSVHYDPHALAAVRNRSHKMSADTIESLSKQLYRYRAQHIVLAEINHLSAQVAKAAGRVI